MVISNKGVGIGDMDGLGGPDSMRKDSTGNLVVMRAGAPLVRKDWVSLVV